MHEKILKRPKLSRDFLGILRRQHFWTLPIKIWFADESRYGAPKSQEGLDLQNDSALTKLCAKQVRLELLLWGSGSSRRQDGFYPDSKRELGVDARFLEQIKTQISWP